MAVKKRGIIMTGDSVRAILDGRKSMTRRVIKPQPTTNLDWATEWGWTFFTPDKHISGRVRNPAIEPREIFLPCPYSLGQRLWVRETWRELIEYDMGHNFIAYRADGEILPPHHADLSDTKWRSPIYMPRWASRITLEVMSVRVEQIQNISEVDAIAEGAWTAAPELMASEMKKNHIGAYRQLWDSINLSRGFGWDTNCYVWAIEFRRITP